MSEQAASRRFVALDRDGTLIVDRGYGIDVAQVELLPGAAAGLKHMARLGLGLVVVTNQSAIARGYSTPERVLAVHQAIDARLAAHGVRIESYEVCPHAPWDGCICRKPAPGLLARAAQRHAFAAERCFVVGDKQSDVELGRDAGAVTFLIGDSPSDGPVRPDYVARDLGEVAARIETLF